MIAQKNIMSAFISNLASSALVTSGHISTLTLGKYGFFDLDGNALANKGAIVNGKFKIAMYTANGLMVSDIIEDANKATQVSAGSAAVEQVDYIGYNGSTGAINAINSNTYLINFWIKSTEAMNGNTNIKQAVWQSTAAATQVEVADGLVKSMINNFSREVEKRIKFERICNNAGTAITGTGTLAVVNGSKYVTAGTDADAVVAVGDYLRIGGTTTAFAMYKVVSFPAGGQFIELDIPYQGVSATVAEASCEYVAAADAVTATWGIKLTGVALNFQEGVFKYEKSMWETQLVDFGTTTVTKSVAASKGVGTYEEVAEIENFLYFNNKRNERLTTPPVVINKTAEVGNLYTLYTISWWSTGTASTVGFDPKSYKQVLLVLDAGNSSDISSTTTFLDAV